MTSVLTAVARPAAGPVEATAPRPGAGSAVMVVTVVALAWAVVVASDLGAIPLPDHDAVLAGDRLKWAAVAGFLLGWQAMVAAMTLPSSFGVLRDRTVHGDGVGGFVAGSGVVWAVFGCAVLGLDAVVHRGADLVPWLASNPQLVAGGVLTAVGVVQLAPSTARCLQACRRFTGPARGASRGSPAVLDGARYGVLCVRCDGPLMVAMLAVGGARAPWMTAFAVAMLVERRWWPGPSVHRWTGIAVVALAAATIAGPS